MLCCGIFTLVLISVRHFTPNVMKWKFKKMYKIFPLSPTFSPDCNWKHRDFLRATDLLYSHWYYNNMRCWSWWTKST